MRFLKNKHLLISCLACLSLLATDFSARADLILGFPQGLTGWSTAGDAGTVSASGGQATITESTFAAETDLFLSFTVPTGAQSLQFTLDSLFADSTVADNNANGYLPDAFGASLVDPNTLNPLVPTVDPTTDSFYTRDIVDGVTQGEAANGVSVSSSPGALALISVDLSTLGLDGQMAEILFRLSGGTDPSSSSTVTISDVKVIAGASVAEPASITSGVTGMAILSVFVAVRRHRRFNVETD